MGLIVSVLKSILLVAYTVYYVTQVYLEAKSYPDVGGSLSFSYSPRLAFNLFPNLFPNGTNDNSGLIVIIITVLYAIIVVLEMSTMLAIGWISVSTYHLVKIVKEINYQSLTTNSRQISAVDEERESPRQSGAAIEMSDSRQGGVGENQNSAAVEVGIEIPQAPALLLRQDSGLNNLITGSIGELPDEENAEDDYVEIGRRFNGLVAGSIGELPNEENEEDGGQRENSPVQLTIEDDSGNNDDARD